MVENRAFSLAMILTLYMIQVAQMVFFCLISSLRGSVAGGNISGSQTLLYPIDAEKTCEELAMLKPRILVTSAAGHTGTPLVRQLLAAGHPVRAFVRREDERSEALRQAGAEIIVGDLFDLRDLRRAMQDVQRAYHCPPFANNLLHNSALFAIAAQEARLEVVALLSGWNPHPLHPSVVTREHWLTNQLYRWMPSVDVIHVNPGLFAFTYMLGLPAIKHFGLFMAPFGQGRNAPPSSEDIALVLSKVLMDPAEHIGKSYRPTGPELLTPMDMAEIYTRILKRKVKYQDAPFELFVKAALAQGFPLMDISQVRYYAEELKNGAFETGAPTDHVELVTGKRPESFEETARRYFQNPSLIHPKLSVGSKLQAMSFLFRMLLTRVPDLEGWERQHGHPLLQNPVLAHDSEEWLANAQEQQLHLLDFS